MWLTIRNEVAPGQLGVSGSSTEPTARREWRTSAAGRSRCAIETNDGQKVVTLSDGCSTAIEPGNTPNVVAAECQDGPDGSTVALRMFVNGVAVASVVDTHDPLELGLVGIIAEDYGDATRVAFDEFSVSAL
jgi:hypothetical protein